MPGEVIPPAARSPRSATILIVEDDESVGQFLQQLIEEDTPYSSVVITNGLTALEQAPYLHPCLLLIDYWLPGMNGLELYDRLQQVESMRDTPAIMMSASLPVRDLEQRGIYQLRKPMNIGNVLRMLTHAMVNFEERQQQMHEQHR
jgi:two-component system response regulator (stage 0 sporulation protein F)